MIVGMMFRIYTYLSNLPHKLSLSAHAKDQEQSKRVEMEALKHRHLLTAEIRTGQGRETFQVTSDHHYVLLRGLPQPGEGQECQERPLWEAGAPHLRGSWQFYCLSETFHAQSLTDTDHSLKTLLSTPKTRASHKSGERSLEPQKAKGQDRTAKGPPQLYKKLEATL